MSIRCTSVLSIIRQTHRLLFAIVRLSASLVTTLLKTVLLVTASSHSSVGISTPAYLRLGMLETSHQPTPMVELPTLAPMRLATVLDACSRSA